MPLLFGHLMHTVQSVWRHLILLCVDVADGFAFDACSKRSTSEHNVSYLLNIVRSNFNNIAHHQGGATRQVRAFGWRWTIYKVNQVSKRRSTKWQLVGWLTYLTVTSIEQLHVERLSIAGDNLHVKTRASQLEWISFDIS